MKAPLKQGNFFERVPNAELIANGLKAIPAHWSLTPLQDKSPKRANWQNEAFIPHTTIEDLILRGDEGVSQKTGKPYHRYWSGFGLRTGEASGGLLAIDVDGSSAQPLLEAISFQDIPTTVSWTSGKPGRYQLLFQLPDEIREPLEEFNRAVVTEWENLKTARDAEGKPTELLEFRYNRAQSCLPPSRHPTTGAYHWINNPADVPVAIAPDWLCQLLLKLASQEREQEEAKAEKHRQISERRQQRQAIGFVGSTSLEDVIEQAERRLTPDEAFSWTGHNWKHQGRKEWIGYCPRHQSKSGTSFHANPETLEWFCHGCNEGGRLVQYRWFVRGGNGTPKGRDFVEIVRGIAADAGVSMPSPRLGYTLPIHGTDTEATDSTLNKKTGIRFRRVRTSLEQFLPTFPNLKSQDGDAWVKLRRFTPDETIDSQYFYYEPPKEGEGLANNSGLGTGKSYYTNEHYISEDEGAFSLANRNTVIEQFVENAKEKHNLTWYLIQQDLKEGGRDDLRLIQDPQSKIISCIDSILYIQPQDAVGKKIVLDEVESTLKHLNYSTTAVSYRRQLCKQRLAEILTESHSILLCDGNLKDITVNYIEKLSGKKIKKVKNLYKGNRGKVTYYVGSQKFKQNEETNEWESIEQRLNDNSLLLKAMMEDPDPFIVGADSQEQLEAWDRELKIKGRKTFRLDGTTSNTPESKKFIRNPADYIQQHGIDIVLYSPSADQGLSIDLKGYFKRGYFFFFGVVLTDTQIQFLGRLRDPGCHLYVYCQVKHNDAKSINSGLLPEDIQEFYLEHARACARLSLLEIDEETRSQRLLELANDLIERSKDIHYQYECQLLAMAYFEQNNLRNCLEYAMREAGWQVEVVTGSKASTSELDEIKKAIRTERSEKILVAAPFTEPSEAQKIERSGVRTEEDKIRLARHKLLGRLPGIENKVITEKKIVRIPAAEVETKTTQNQVSLEAETQLQQGLEGVQIAPIECIDQQGVSGQIEAIESVAPSQETSDPESTDFVEIEQEVTRPAFDADFIKRVKFQDRGLISRLEGQVLLRNPHIAKLAQQRKWQKKLALFVDENEVDGVKRINLTTYKSPWLKIHTLLEMGISYFIQPQSSWTQETPEAIAFWERGKDPKIARLIGLEVGESDACKYIGRVLDSYGVKREVGKKVTLPSGKRGLEYRPKPLDPISQAIYDCVETKLMNLTGEEKPVMSWAEIIEKSASTEAETQLQQGLEAVQIAPIECIDQQGVSGQIEAIELAEALNLCESPADFASVIEEVEASTIEDAISLQDSQPQRQQLRQWWEGSQSRLVEVTEETEQAIASHPPLESYQVGDEVLFYHPFAEQRWLRGVVEQSGGLIRAVSGFFGRMIENPLEICPGHWALG